MATPVLALAMVGAGGYAVYRAFRERNPHKSNAANGWQNEAFMKQEEARKARDARRQADEAPKDESQP
ncbi:hypothetical protein [Qipengyuania sp. JC766]|uniref:hypothetical protein n=1 Tax=Qipengyuania sp. JC766 TaxID=3232139 RepID=UPI00345B2705